MNKEYLEVLGKNIRYKKEYVGNDTYRLYIKKNEIELLENYLTELEQIDNAKKDINSLYSNMHQTSDELDKSLKDSLLKNAKIEAIDNSNPSEALESSVVLKFVVDLLKRYEGKTDYNIYITREWLLEIKQSLITKSKKELAFDLIKEKSVMIHLLKCVSSVEEYNDYVSTDEQLTQEEFELLKEVL